MGTQILPFPMRAPRRREQLSRFLFDLRASDLAHTGLLVARSGQIITFTRASDGRVVDSQGNFLTARHSAVRLEQWDANGDGVRESATLLLEKASSNRLLHNADFTAWTATNSPAITSGFFRRGDLVLTQINDASAVNAARVSEVCAMGVDGTKVFGVAAAQGVAPAASGTLVQLTDSTGPADRLNATLKWDGNGVPQVTTATGTFIGAFPLGGSGAGRVWWLVWQTTSATASHTNTVQITPATTDGQTGDVFLGLPQIEDGRIWSSPLTTAGSLVSRSADIVSAAIDFPPQTLTLYGKLILQSTADGANDQLLRVGTPDLLTDSNVGVGLYRDSGSNLIARQTDASTHTEASVSMSAALAATPNGAHEFLANWTWDPDTHNGTLAISFDGGAPTSTAIHVNPAFTSNTVTLPGDNNVRWIEAKIAAGSHTLAEMRTQAS